VTDKEIKIGQTQPYSGPVSAWSVQGRVDIARFDGSKWVRFGDLVSTDDDAKN
jgi:hypothetical protein